MKDNERFIAVDLGTQGTKTALMDARGNAIARAFTPAVFLSEQGGVIAQDANQIYEGVLRTIRDVMEQSGCDPRSVLAVGVVGQMAGILGVDEALHPVTEYDSGLDKRCESSVEELKRRCEEPILRQCGCPIIVAQGAKMFWWKENRPDAYRAVRAFLPISSYVCCKMAGLSAKDAYIDDTHIHLTCMADNERAEWSQELIDALGFDARKLPQIVSPAKKIGGVTKECAALTGLMEGTPIAAGCGDTAASGLGAGLVRDNMLLDVAGTASILAACVSRYSPDAQDKTLIFQRSIVPGLWMPFSFVLGGQALDWYQRQLCARGEVSFAELDKEAREVQNDSLYFLPFFAGRVCPSNPNFSGHWLGMKFYHTRANLYRSIMEAIAFEYRYYLERLRAQLPESRFTKVYASGGGAKSTVFAQIKADTLGLPFVPLKNKDTSHRAAALLAGQSIGRYEDVASAALCMVEKEEEDAIAFNEASYALNSARYQTYCQLVSQMERVHRAVAL